MNRREFLKKAALGATALSTTALSTLALKPISLFAAENASYPDLVAVRGGEPKELFDRGIDALGGMKNFVRKGQTVLIKPNMAWAVAPERAGNTNPELLRAVIKHCLEAGAKSVSVFDHTCDEWHRAYSTSMLESVAKGAGATVAPGHIEGHYQKVSISGETLKEAKVHELYLSSDVVINLPVLKHHSGAGMTAAMKNLMGVVWNRGDYHRLSLDRCIADFCTFKRPTLNIVDAYKVMLSGGPRGNPGSQYSNPKMLIFSTDIIAADTAAARTFDSQPGAFSYIGWGERLGVGSTKLDEMNIQRITL